MKIKLRMKPDNNDNEDIPVPVSPVISSKRMVGVGGFSSENDLRLSTPTIIKPVRQEDDQEKGLPPPPPSFREDKILNPDFDLSKEIKYFGDVYSQVFGADLSLINKDLIMLNLLFAIYSELSNLRAESNNRRV